MWNETLLSRAPEKRRTGEFRKGEYVVIEPEEIKKIEPRTAKAMEILEFASFKLARFRYYER